MYQVQSDSTIEWLSTSRNTLVAANDTVSTLQANATPNYDSWFAPVNRYLRIAQGVLVAAAAISLIVLSARIVWNIGQGGEGPSARPHRLDTARRAARLLVREHRAHVLLPLVRRQSGPAVMDAGRRHHVLPVGLHPYAG